MIVQFERTRDLDRVRWILTQPEIWAKVIDDSAPHSEEWQPNGHPDIWYVTASVGPHLLGLFTFIPLNAVCFEIHVAMRKLAWGRPAEEAGKQIWAWMWEHSPARRIVATAPAFNRLVVRYAERSGMKKYGVNEKSFLRFGRLHDQVLLGISPTE